jgi:hypothetical protein
MAFVVLGYGNYHFKLNSTPKAFPYIIPQGGKEATNNHVIQVLRIWIRTAKLNKLAGLRI